MNKKAADYLSKCRMQLLMKVPFFGTLALRLLVEEDSTIETMATNGTVLKYNPDFTLSLSIEEVQGVIAHEVLHCALGHIWRIGDRDMAKANIAADYCVNEILIDAGFQLPQGVLISPEKNLAFEERYARLPASPQQQQQGQQQQQQGKPSQSQQGQAGQSGQAGQQQQVGQGQGSKDAKGRPHPSRWGEMQKPAKPSSQGQGQGQGQEQSQQMTEADWQVATEQTARVCKDAGKFAGNLLRQSRENRKPVTDCWELLKRFISQTLPTDYSWASPNRRYTGMGLTLPSLRADSLGEIVCAIDTSGSVGAAAISNFLSHLAVILDEYKPSKLHMIEVDTQVCKHTEFDTYSSLDTVSVHGGGGTYFQPAFDWVDSTLSNPPSVFIYLTDGYPADKPIEPSYPVIWAYCQDSNPAEPAFGALIRLPRE